MSIIVHGIVALKTKFFNYQKTVLEKKSIVAGVMICRVFPHQDIPIALGSPSAQGKMLLPSILHTLSVRPLSRLSLSESAIQNE